MVNFGKILQIALSAFYGNTGLTQSFAPVLIVFWTTGERGGNGPQDMPLVIGRPNSSTSFAERARFIARQLSL